MDIKISLNKDFERCLDDLRIKYGEDFEFINGVHPSQLDYSEFLGKFANKKTLADSTIDPNANAFHRDLKSFTTEKSKPEDKVFALNKIFYEIKKKWGLKTAKKWLDLEFSKALYLNDASTASYFPYCWANDLTRLATEGLFFIGENYNNEPPKHLETYFDDVIELISFLSNRQSGAVGIPNVLIWAYYFWKKDVEDGYYLKTPEIYLRQVLQKFIFRLNQPFIRIDQSAFTNVSIFDRKYLEALFGGVEFPDGSFAIDQIEEILEVQKVFMEVVAETRSRQMFTFPVITTSLLYNYKTFTFEDEDFARWACRHNIKWSDTNFFISDNVGVLSNCCRLLSDTKELDPFINSIGGTALSVGSCRVSTINLVRIAYEVLNLDKPLDDKYNLTAKDRYIKLLKERVELDCKALYSMRHIIKRNIEKGFLPNYQEGALELEKQFCTIGGMGLFEVMDLFGLINTDEFGYKSYSDEAIEFSLRILEAMNEVKDNFTKEQECDFKYNIEFIPGENVAGVLCTADNLLFEQNRYFIYSNQWIPLMAKCTIQEKCKLSGLFDKKCGGGSIAHINIEGRFPNEEAAWDMLNYVAKQGVIYFAFTTKISVCKHRHAFIGTSICPVCGGPVADTFMRIVGFYTPQSAYSAIRKKESSLREWTDPGSWWSLDLRRGSGLGYTG